MHHGTDQRRDPYEDHSFAYYPSLELLQEAEQGMIKSLDPSLT